MSFSSLLSQIKHKTKDSESKPSYSYNPDSQKKSNTTSHISSTRPQSSKSSYEPPRTIDPAIQRLKELRRLENSKKEAQNPKPKAQRQKRNTTSSTNRTAIARRRRTPEVSIKESALADRPRSSSPQKRLTFAELMNQAQEKSKALKEGKKEEPVQSSIQPNKYVSKTQPKVTQPRNQRSTSAPSSDSTIRRPIPGSTSLSTSRPVSRPHSRSKEPVVSKPKEFAKPSAKLQARLEEKKKRQAARRASRFDEEDSYESDFIEDDEELDGYEEEEAGYDRDEIWKIFNRGKTRSDYYDDEDDLSDMEATGSEVMNEELRSAKRARLEEQAEQERERKRIEEKRRRLGKK